MTNEYLQNKIYHKPHSTQCMTYQQLYIVFYKHLKKLSAGNDDLNLLHQ